MNKLAEYVTSVYSIDPMHFDMLLSAFKLASLALFKVKYSFVFGLKN